MNQTLPLDQFNKLTKPEKLAILEECGTHLELQMKYGGNTLALFSLYSYYVVVTLNEKTDRLTKVAAFDDYSMLDPFLANIDLLPVYAML